MNSMLLLTAMSVGQLPGGAPPAPPGGVILPPLPARVAAQPPGMLPPAGAPGMPPVAMPPGMPPAGMPPMNGEKKDEEKKEEEKKDEEKKPEPFALMRALKGTPAGDRLADLGIDISGWAQG